MRRDAVGLVLPNGWNTSFFLGILSCTSFEIYSRFFCQTCRLTCTTVYGSTAEGFDNNVLVDRPSTQTIYETYIVSLVPIVAKVVSSATLPSKEYTISIPKINIYDAKVRVGGEVLKKSLVHYQPVTLPGSVGNTVIFGHSTLPQLYNVNDYKTIFTFLPSLSEGDVIKVGLQNNTYEYVVSEMFVVKPDQVSVLNQTTDSSILTLVTCVPPGTYWNRLVVRAKLKTGTTQL